MLEQHRRDQRPDGGPRELQPHHSLCIEPLGDLRHRHNVAAEYHRGHQRPEVAPIQTAGLGRCEEIETHCGHDQSHEELPRKTMPEHDQGYHGCENGRHRDDERRAGWCGVLQPKRLSRETRRQQQREQCAGAQLRARKPGAQIDERREDERRDRETRGQEKQGRGGSERVLDDHEADAPHGRGRDQQQIGATLGHAKSRKYRPVADSATCATSSGVPAATTRPP